MRPLFALSVLPILLAGCAKPAAQQAREAPLVKAATVSTTRFVDRIDAVGTARANEQVTLSAPVTERIVRLNFEDGGFVSRGQVIAVLAQNAQAAQLAGAQATAREAGQQLQRVQQLRERGFATNSNVDTQIARAAAASSQAAAATAAIGDRVIRAPFGGFVSPRMISAGAVVQAGTEIATISDISAIKLDFRVPETVLGGVAPGQAIAAVAAAFPDRPFRGVIAVIDPVVDPSTRSALVRAILPNPDRMLKPGMLLTVTVESKVRMAPSVPELAVVGQGDQSYVFVIGADGVVKRTPVRVGVRNAGMVEIAGGVPVGAKVVGEGVVKVTDGGKVRLVGAPALAAAR